MKIITCNLPEPFISTMKKLIYEYGFYPSRSELIRVAVRELVIKERAVLKQYEEFQSAGKLPLAKRMIDMRTIRGGWKHPRASKSKC